MSNRLKLRRLINELQGLRVRAADNQIPLTTSLYTGIANELSHIVKDLEELLQSIDKNSPASSDVEK